MANRRTEGSSWAPGTNCLVLTGSTESDRYLVRLSDSLTPQTEIFADFFWAPGPYASNDLRVAALSNGFHVIGPTDLNEAKMHANVSISRFGVSAIEMLSLGVPTVILPDFQQSERSEIAALRDLELAIVIDDYSLLRTAVEMLVANPRLAEALSRNCLRHFAPPTDEQLRQVIGLN